MVGMIDWAASRARMILAFVALTLSIGAFAYVGLPKEGEPEMQKGGPEPAHMANFLDCMRTRREPNANAVDGHYAAMACHIGNMAYREGRRVEWNPRWDV